MLKRILTLFILSISIELNALELVDRYLENKESAKAVNRLFYISKDESNFISNNFGERVTPQEIFERVEKAKEISSSEEEKRVIDNFFNQDEVKSNIFIASYLLLKEKRYFEAVQKCEYILNYYPDNLYALLCRADASINTTDHSQAEDSYKKLIKLYPKKVEYRYRLLELYLRDERVKDGRELFDETESLFSKDKSLKSYREKVEDAESLWVSIFGYGEESNIEKNEENITSSKKEIKRVEIDEPKTLKREDDSNSTGFSALLELNRFQDYSILNRWRNNSLIEENIYGVDEISPQDHNNLYIRPNIDLFYNIGFSQYIVGVELNYFHRYYFSGDNMNYGVLSPSLLFLDPKRDYSIDFTLSQIGVDGDSINTYGFGFNWKIFGLNFRTTYRINSFSNSDLDRDTLSLSFEKDFQFSSSEFRMRYLVALNSLMTESKVPYIPTGSIDQNSSIDTNISTPQMSSIYPSSYMSHQISINYLLNFWESLFWESGIELQYRTFDIDRSDIKTEIFTLLEYKFDIRNSFAGYIKRVDNYSSEEKQDFDETVIGVNYILDF